MDYTIKQKFTAHDLKVGNLVYDSVHDALLKVAYLGKTIKIQKGSGSDIKDECIQIIFEDTKNGKLIQLDVFGKEGILPKDRNGNNQFRHLLQIDESEPRYTYIEHSRPVYYWDGFRYQKYYEYYPSPYYKNWWHPTISSELTSTVNNIDIPFGTETKILNENEDKSNIDSSTNPHHDMMLLQGTQHGVLNQGALTLKQGATTTTNGTLTGNQWSSAQPTTSITGFNAYNNEYKSNF